MTPDQFSRAVTNFRKAALPGRNLYLWCGDRRPLLGILGSELVVPISALDLDLPGELPLARAEHIRRGLELALEHWFDKLMMDRPARSLAVVYDLAVLAYYRVSLGAIYRRHASDRRMTVLCVEPTQQVSGLLPGVFEYNPLATQRYFSEQLPPDNVVEVPSNASSTD